MKMRSIFSSNSKPKDVLSFYKSGSTLSFNPDIAFASGSKRISWRFDNGSGKTQIAGNSIVYTGFTTDSNLRTVEIRSNSLDGVNNFFLDGDNIFGHLDLSLLTNLSGLFHLHTNPYLTGITHSPSSGSITEYQVYSSNLTGHLDLSPLSGLGNNFRIAANPNLTGITHSPSPHSFTTYQINQCNITGNLDLSQLILGGSLQMHTNPNLTGITHGPSLDNFSSYQVYDCNLIGNLDLSPLSGLGGQFYINSNSNLTGITHKPSSNNFSLYYAYNCNLTGIFDLSMFTGLGGQFNITSNPNLTGIIHTASTNVFSSYQASSCNLNGNLNLSMLSNLGGDIAVNNNINLTGVTLPTSSSERARAIDFRNCNIQGTIILSGFSSIGSSSSSGVSTNFKCSGNSGLTNVVFANSTGYFRNDADNTSNSAFQMHDCSLGYINFIPLSGATLISGVTIGIPRFELWNNGMTVSEVNHILSDFDLISNLNYSGWTATSGTTGGFLSISGNTAPDGSSGGYNGTASKANLIAKGWVVATD